MHRPVLLALVVTAGACSPSEAPLSPQFAGWWKPAQAPMACERAAMRFDQTALYVRRDGLPIKVFDVVEAKLEQGSVRMTLRVSNENAIMAAIYEGKAAMATELPKRAIFLTMRRSGDRLLPSNVLIQEDGPRGLRAPGPGEARALARIFTMTPCAA